MKQPLSLLNSSLNTLLKDAHSIARLDIHWQKLLPIPMRKRSRVVRLDDDILVVYVDQNSVAARLRLMQKQLIEGMQKQGIPVSSLKVKIAASLNAPQKTKKIALSAQALSALDEGRQQIKDPSIQEALAKLIMHHSNK